MSSLIVLSKLIIHPHLLLLLLPTERRLLLGLGLRQRPLR